MKVQLIFLQNEKLVTKEHMGVSIQQLTTLEPSSCEEIVINGGFDFIPPTKVEILRDIISKLHYDGQLVIIGSHLNALCYKYTSGQILLSELQNILYSRSYMWSPFELSKFFETYGLKNIEFNFIESSSSFVIKGFKVCQKN